MQKKTFEAWLRTHPKHYSYSVIKGYPTECAWIERHLEVDLDEEYARDRMQSVLDRLSFNDGHNPLAKLINGNLYNNLATYKRAAGSYINFCDSQRGESRTESLPKQPESVPERQEATAVFEHGVMPVPDELGPISVSWLDWIRNCTVSELLALHAAALDELRRRDIVRSANGPGGDYAELLFTRAFGWVRAENSTTGYDAVDWSQRRYQIKSRRLSGANTSRQLSALRRLPDQNFDYLAAVLFEKDYTVRKAAMIPHGTVLSRACFREHTNSWNFFLDDGVWSLPDVRDVTAELRRVAAELDTAV